MVCYLRLCRRRLACLKQRWGCIVSRLLFFFLLEMCVPPYIAHDAALSPFLIGLWGVAQTCEATHLAVHQCRRLLESSTAAPPSLNRQLGMVMLALIAQVTHSL